MINESLLHFIWKYKYFHNALQLCTVDGKHLQILQAGTINTNAGPDILNAKIKIDNTIWVGNIEIHVNASDWYKHTHHHDEKYKNIILHVVYCNDKDVMFENNVHTFEMKNFIETSLIDRFYSLMQEKEKIACAKHIHNVTPISKIQQVDKMYIDRLQAKSQEILYKLHNNNHNWQEIFYHTLSRNFGVHINQDAFELLATSIPLQVIAKHKNNLFQLEALLFGQAGMLLHYFEDTYPQLLQKEYLYLKKLHKLNPIEEKHWRFLRLRPANFPTIRIAQFAQLLHTSTHLFSSIRETKNLKQLIKLFNIDVSDYWHSHYNFDKKTKEKIKHTGKTFIHSIIINTVIPMLYIYGKTQNEEKYCEKALSMLSELPAEKNNITRIWSELNIEIENAYMSQAYIHLYNHYCTHKKCLDCVFGYEILRTKA